MLYFICLIASIGSQDFLQASDDDKVLQRQVRNFRMHRGFASTIEDDLVGHFIEMTDEQRNKILTIVDGYRGKADSIIDRPAESWAEKHERLIKLRGKQDEELRTVLQPEQLSRLAFLKPYAKIHRQGFANSLSRGDLAKHLALSDEEQRGVDQASLDSVENFHNRAIEAQKHAIARIRESLPKEKRKGLDTLLKPLLAHNGTLWEVDLKMLRTPSMQRKAK